MNPRTDSVNKKSTPQVEYFDPDEVDLLVLVRGLKSQKLTIVVTAALGLILGLIYISAIPQSYQASVEIRPPESLDIIVDSSIIDMDSSQAYLKTSGYFQSMDFREALTSFAESSAGGSESALNFKFTSFEGYALVSTESRDPESASATLMTLVTFANEYGKNQISTEYKQKISNRLATTQIKLDGIYSMGGDYDQFSDLPAGAQIETNPPGKTPKRFETMQMAYSQVLFATRSEIQYLLGLSNQNFSEFQCFQIGDITAATPKLLNSNRFFALAFSMVCGLFAGILLASYRVRNHQIECVD